MISFLGMDDVQLLFTSFPAAVGAGAVVGVVCSLFGVFIILRRVIFIGMALGELAACGVAGALFVGVPPLAGAALLTMGGSALFSLPSEDRRLPRDAGLGILFVAAGGLAVLFAAAGPHGLEEVKALLYGDLILSRWVDVGMAALLLIPAAGGLFVFLRPILHVFVDRDMALVLGLKPRVWELFFFLLLGLVVAVASKMVGAVLVFCYLIVPSSIGLLVSKRLGVALAVAGASSLVCTLAGLVLSLSWDTPTNATIAVVNGAVLALAAVWRGLANRWRRALG